MTQTDGNIYHVLRLKEVTLSKWLYYLRQSTYSMQPYQINNDIFHKTKKKFVLKYKRLWYLKQSREGRTKLEESCSLSSDYNTNWQYQSQSEVAQLCPTLWDPMDCSLPGSTVRGIFQARILKWVAISFSRRSSWPKDWTWVSCIVGRHFTVWATREVVW